MPPVEAGRPPPAEGRPQGLDLSYSDVVGLLYELSQKKSLGAPLVLQPLTFRGGSRGLTSRPIGEKEEESPLSGEP